MFKISVLIFLQTCFALFAEGALEHATISAYAIDMKTGKVVIDENGSRSVIPASCMKIVTAGAALHLLGPEMRFETHLEYDGGVDAKGTLLGNLYIRGGGDPCLGSERVAGALSWQQQLEVWVAAVVQLGIRKIQGRVIADETRWEKALAVPSWQWEDLGQYYGVGACALSFHENCYFLTFKPAAKVGGPTSVISVEPPLAQLILKNEVTTGPHESGDLASIYGSEYSDVRCARGTIPAGVERFTIKGSIPDPARFCADSLSQALSRKQIVIEQKDLPLTQNRKTLHTTFSPPLKEIVYWSLQKSINLYAEHLLKKIGEVVKGEGSTQAGIAAVREFWRAQQLNLVGFHMADGSGLSRKNFVTAHMLVGVLLKMKEWPDFACFLPHIQEGICAKSGSMFGVKGYAGYYGDCAFAIVVNHSLDAEETLAKVNDFFKELKKKKRREIPSSS